MKFFITRLFFQNRAPFENLDISLGENEIALLTAANGRGKTTILSHIADALHEIAKLKFFNSFAGKENHYYRISQGVDNLDPNKPSIFYMRCRLDNKDVDYIYLRGQISEEEYNSIPIDNKIDYQTLTKNNHRNSTIKHTTLSQSPEAVESLFKNNIATYFPSYRFERPGYINSEYETKINFRKFNTFSGNLINPLEVVSGLEPIANWMMDIVLDMQYTDLNVGLLKSNVDQLITLILTGKQRKNLRYGIGPRNFGHTRIQILNSDNNEQVYPTIFNLSAGEAGALCIFGELIRQADNINNRTKISDSVGLVLIDEVDKHLHIKLQKEVLPKLFSLFPNVQFILSSHSPFLSMGLAENNKDRTKIIDLDSFGITTDPTTNELYTEVYEMMVSDSLRFRDEYIKLREEIKTSHAPLIVTEGKTDIQHIRKAQKVLDINEKLDYFNVPGDWGDKKLKVLLEQLSKVPQHRKIIGIFDRDAPEIIKLIEGDGQSVKDFGNNVYGICLPTPPEREKYAYISIEFLYSDKDILKEHEGKRIFFDNEIRFYQEGDRQEKQRPEKAASPNLEKEYTKKIFDTDIGYLPEAHSKSVFADLIENHPTFSDGIKFNNFTPIFDKIKSILKR